MEGIMNFLYIITVIVVAVLLIRWIGAWMLRIDEVITLQKEILKELKNKNQ
ncbi:hypothetical protein [Flavobacterium sp. GT3P67]|uniref:hypothetical protein n=1 Tax=Flavobacterium sp. GT3P67 TaxID=2541722 RepID=UPI0014047339|nr:hypothetical protein [Flavobacterium sp. GT3P67]